MRLRLLHLDDALELQPAFLSRCREAGAAEIRAEPEGALVRLWGRPAELDALKAKLAEGFARSGGRTGAPLTFLGSGDFHHVTALMLELVLEEAREPVTVLHFDNHPDWVHFGNGMHCGSWVNRALAHPLVDKVVTVGVCSSDLSLPEWKGANLAALQAGRLELFAHDHPPSRVRKAYGEGAGHRQEGRYIRWHTIAECGEGDFVARLLRRIRTEAVYVTVDKDVLERGAAVTNWDQGRMTLAYLLMLLRAVGARHRIAGADVTGDYSRPVYAGSLFRRMAKWAEILLDQPARPKDATGTAALNAAVNRTLLDAFAEMMA